MVQTSDFLILDGGLATELESRGHVLNDALWSARLLRDAPAEIRAVHRNYLEAGADIITTASYQSSIAGFISAGMNPSEAEVLIASSVQIAKEERDLFWNRQGCPPSRSRPRVAASVGPYGAFLANGAEYTGEYRRSVAALLEFHHARWRILAGQDPEIMLCETIPSFAEVEALLRLANEFPGRETWISFCCRDGKRISDGTPIRQCAALLDAASDVSTIGVNCTSPRFVGSLIDEIRLTTDKPIVVYPNSGEAFDAATKSWTGDPCIEDFARQARNWWSRGAQVIGGCCRTTPAHIRALQRIRDDLANVLPEIGNGNRH